MNPRSVLACPPHLYISFERVFDLWMSRYALYIFLSINLYLVNWYQKHWVTTRMDEVYFSVNNVSPLFANARILVLGQQCVGGCCFQQVQLSMYIAMGYEKFSFSNMSQRN